MACVWDCGTAGIVGTDVLKEMERERSLALTTVLTTLDRLHDKGIVRRDREGKAYRYWAAITEDELQQRIVDGVLDRLIAQFPRAVATYFAQQGAEESCPIQGETLADLACRIEAMETSPSGVNHDH